MASVTYEHATKVFGSVVAVQDLTIDIPDKEFLVFVGPSGCGKTTSLRLLAGLEELTAGNIYIGDRLVNDVPPKDRNIAMVFQSYALYPHMSVFDNMAFGLKLRKTPKTEIERRVKEAGVILGLENTLSAVQNLDICDRVKSDAVQVYYDIRNSTSNGYDVPAEIRLLDDRMCQIHFKDGSDYLGEGIVEMAPVAEALNDIAYAGWIVLETSTPSKDRNADFKRNAEYVRNLMGMV